MTKINKVFDKYFDLCETILFYIYTLFSFSFAQFFTWGTASSASPNRTSLFSSPWPWDIGGGTGGALAPHFFFRGAVGGPNLRDFFLK